MIKAIFIAREHGEPQQLMSAVKVTQGNGIVGDRNYGLMKEQGQNITFVEIEAINAFNDTLSQNISLADTRRNIVTEGIDLNQLVGKEFSIGSVRFYGVELCEPCALLGHRLANEGCKPAQVVAAWQQRGGLRANVLSSGVLTLGDTLSVSSAMVQV